jgi:hypothetical protein
MTGGSSVLTGSCVVGVSSVVSTGGGVESSANTLVGKIMDDTNEIKRTIEKTVSFFVDFIAVAPSHPGLCKRPGRVFSSITTASG